MRGDLARRPLLVPDHAKDLSASAARDGAEPGFLHVRQPTTSGAPLRGLYLIKERFKVAAARSATEEEDMRVRGVAVGLAVLGLSLLPITPSAAAPPNQG